MSNLIPVIHSLRILFYIGAAIGALVIAWHTFKNFRKAKENGDYQKIIYNTLTLISIIIAAVSWILNFGWLRYVASLLLLPILHCLLFWFVENYTATHVKNSKLLWISIFISYVTFVMFYLFLPDANGTKDLYALFKNITGTKAVDMCFYVSMISFITNSLVLIFQMIFGMYVKKKINN